MIKLKYDAPINEWLVIPEGVELEMVDCEYSGFTGVKYKGNEYFLHNGYFVTVPELVNN